MRQRIGRTLLVVALLLLPMAWLAGEVLYRTMAETAVGTFLYNAGSRSATVDYRFVTADGQQVHGSKVLLLMRGIQAGDQVTVRYVPASPEMFNTLEGLYGFEFLPIGFGVGMMVLLAGVWLLLPPRRRRSLPDRAWEASRP